MKNHPCITGINDYLASRNGKLARLFEFTTMGFNVTPRIQIATEKLDSKKRRRPPLLVAAYCPFCGEKL